jgi:hypothetical protein
MNASDLTLWLGKVAAAAEFIIDESAPDFSTRCTVLDIQASSTTQLSARTCHQKIISPYKFETKV